MFSHHILGSDHCVPPPQHYVSRVEGRALCPTAWRLSTTTIPPTPVMVGGIAWVSTLGTEPLLCFVVSSTVA